MLLPWSLVEDVFRKTQQKKQSSVVVMSIVEECFFLSCNVFTERKFLGSNLKRLHHSTTKNKQSTTEKQLRTLVDKYHTKVEHKHNQHRQKSHSTSTRMEKTQERKQKGSMKYKKKAAFYKRKTYRGIFGFFKNWWVHHPAMLLGAPGNCLEASVYVGSFWMLTEEWC